MPARSDRYASDSAPIARPDRYSGQAPPPAAGADSVPLDAYAADDGPQKEEGPRLRVANIKLLLALFLMFIVVVSDVFTNSIIAGFGENAVRGRSLTAWGTVLQGIFLVIGYCVALYLTEHHIL